MTDVQQQPLSGSAGLKLRPLTNHMMNRRYQRLAAWSALPFLIMMFGGLILSHFITPPSPAASAHTIAHLYRAHYVRIRLWLTISSFAFVFLFFFFCAIATQTRRIEGGQPLLSYIQVAGIGCGSWVFLLPWVCWETAAFRPMQSPSVIQALNDVGWIIFTFAWWPYGAGLFAIAAAIFSDRRERPLFPRWCAYFNIWTAIAIAPDNLIVFWKHGPMDWRGFFPYWFAFVAWGSWVAVMMVMTLRAINTQDEENPTTEEVLAAKGAAVTA
jgi:hypothetical protein